MRSGVLRNLSFVSRSHEPRPNRTEPRLLPPNAPSPSERAAIADLEILPASGEGEPRAPISPSLAALDRRAAAAAKPGSGSLPFLAFAGCAALAIVALVGAGFLRFAAPADHTATIAGHNLSNLPQARDQPGPAAPAPAPAPSPPAATAAIPEALPAQHAALDNAAPKPEGNVAPAQLQPLPGAAPPAQTRPSAPAKMARPAPAGPDAGEAAAEQDFAAASSAPDHRATSATTVLRRPAHTRIARHAHLRSAHPARLPAPQSLPEQPTPPPSDQAASFDRLVSQLTQPARPAAPALTPPVAGAPDPFAAPAAGGPPAQ